MFYIYIVAILFLEFSISLLNYVEIRYGQNNLQNLSRASLGWLVKVMDFGF